MDKWISSHFPNSNVKYTKGKLYLGVIDANRVTYSKNPNGSYQKNGNEFKIGLKKYVRENSEGWELEDHYTYNEKYIIRQAPNGFQVHKREVVQLL